MGKATQGNRYKNGRKKQPSTVAARLAQAWDYGNDRARARRVMFDAMCIKGGKAVDEVHDGIGQLWAVGLLDGHGICDKALRDAGRDYARLYWRTYNATAPKTGKLEPASRTSENGEIPDTQGWEVAFRRMDEDLGETREEKAAIVACCVDPWFADGSAGFAVRLVNAELHKLGRGPEFCELPTQQDKETLQALIRGLCLLVDGQLPERRRAA